MEKHEDHREPDTTVADLQRQRMSRINGRIGKLRKLPTWSMPNLRALEVELGEIDINRLDVSLDLVMVVVDERTWYVASFIKDVSEFPIAQGLVRVRNEEFVEFVHWQGQGDGHNFKVLLELAKHTRFSVEDGVGSTHLWEEFVPDVANAGDGNQD